MAIKYQEGKTYLRDVRTGREYEYEPILAGMSYVEAFVPLPVEVEKAASKPPVPKPNAPKLNAPKAGTVTDSKKSDPAKTNGNAPSTEEGT